MKTSLPPPLPARYPAFIAPLRAQRSTLLEIPGRGLGLWKSKRSLSAKPGKRLYLACEDLKPRHRFLVNSGSARYPITPDLDAIGLTEMAENTRWSVEKPRFVGDGPSQRRVTNTHPPQGNTLLLCKDAPIPLKSRAKPDVPGFTA